MTAREMLKVPHKDGWYTTNQELSTDSHVQQAVSPSLLPCKYIR